MLIALVWGALFFMAGMRMIWMIGLAGTAAVGLAGAYLLVPHVRARVHIREGGGDVGRGHRSLLGGAPSARKHIEAPSQGLGKNVRTRQRPRARGIITCCP